MAKLIQLLVIIGTISIPIVSATASNPRRGLFRALAGIVVFNLLYLLAILFVYPHLQ